MESNNKNSIDTNENRHVSYFKKNHNINGNAKNNTFDLEIQDLTLENGKIETDENATNETYENSRQGNADSLGMDSTEEDQSIKPAPNEFDNRLDDSDPSPENNGNNTTALSDENDDGNYPDENTSQDEEDPDGDKDTSKNKEDSGDDENTSQDKENANDDENSQDENNGNNELESKNDNEEKTKNENNKTNQNSINNNSSNDKESNSNKQDNANNKENENTPNDNGRNSVDKNTSSSQNENKANDTNQNASQKPKQDNAIDKKRNDAKEKQKRNPNKGGSGVKDKLKNGAKNKMKNVARNAADNSKIGQKINDTKDKIDRSKNAIDTAKKTAKVAKKATKAVAKTGKAVAKAVKGLFDLFVSTLPWSAIILAIVILFVFLIILFSSLSSGIGGDVNEDEELSEYSEIDKTVLKELQKLADKYPNSDPSLAMATVLYPYMNTLWGGDVDAIIGATDNSFDSDKEEETDEEKEEDSDVGDDINKEDGTVSDDDIYLEPFQKRSVRKKFKKVLKEIDGKTNYVSNRISDNVTTTSSTNETYSGTKYNLTNSELTWIAKLCQQEQGSAKGAAAEASLIANKYEMSGSNLGIYKYVKDSSWWNLSVGMSKPSQSVMEAVKDVLVNGNRVFPNYVNEHDCIDCGIYGFDIVKIKTDNKVITNHSELKNHSNYIQDKTIIYNRYGSIYTFFSFPTSTSDPFGYTQSAYNKMTKGNTTETASEEISAESDSSTNTSSSNDDDELETTTDYSEELYDSLNEYFDWDNGYWTYSGTDFNGYKKMFNSVDDDKKDDLARAIVEDLMENKSWFIDYFYTNKSCSSAYQSAGTVEVDDLLKGNVLVDVKVSSCDSSKKVSDCESMYDTPITLEKYVKGVTYEELLTTDIEKTKAQMLAAKSYTLGRRSATVDSNGNYVIQMRANTFDQEYCDIDLGCKSGKTIVGEHSTKRDSVDDATRKRMDEAWNAVANLYIYDTKKKKTAGSYCRTRTGECNTCQKGTCLSHEEVEKYKGTDFMSIIGDQYSSYKVINMDEGVGNLLVSSGLTCSGTNTDGSCGLPDDNFKYYNQKDYTTSFCNRDDATIATSGCGVTSMAMVIANLTDNTNITPEDTMKEASDGHYCGTGVDDGTNAEYFSVAAKKYGLTYKALSVDKKGVKDAENILRSGGLIIANVNSNSPFTSKDHYTVIRKIDSDGKVYVGDSYHDELYNKPYDLSSFINGWISNGHGWYGFTSDKSKDIVAKYCTSASFGNTNGKFASNTRSNGEHTGQCIVYVEKRAVEIINSATVGYEKISDRSKYKRVWSEEGFGCAKYALLDGPKATKMKKLFNYSGDVTKPQAGAVIVWNGTKNNCGGEPAGHVAVIEEVKDNGNVIVSQSNWCSNCEKFSRNELTQKQIKNYGGNHPFIGYIYLLQPK